VLVYPSGILLPVSPFSSRRLRRRRQREWMCMSPTSMSRKTLASSTSGEMQGAAFLTVNIVLKFSVFGNERSNCERVCVQEYACKNRGGNLAHPPGRVSSPPPAPLLLRLPWGPCTTGA